MTLEGPPPSEDGPRVNLGSGPGPGMGRPAGRGAGPNLQGPPRGVGGPSSQMMQPAARAGPQLNMGGRGGMPGMMGGGMPPQMGRGGPMGPPSGPGPMMRGP